MQFDLNLGTGGGEATGEKIVRNVLPTSLSQKKLAIIGEAPGQHEVEQGEPFVGASGAFLTGCLTAVGVMRSACFIGNVCQHRPVNNNIKSFSWHGPEIKAGLDALRNDLMKFQPNLCLLLGGTAMTAAGLGSFGTKKGEERLGELARNFVSVYGRFQSVLWQEVYGHIPSILHPPERISISSIVLCRSTPCRRRKRNTSVELATKSIQHSSHPIVHSREMP